ncbi:putative feruloyl esterase b [Rosellinia necatrix]|uniref:Carboxylic ester hydrolase n=1 Tax=Rosellinia necatrix TaxID=77044 RepID=A0A1W2TWN8_ROSNE|nr:putative feruloyl esterase b [Rosellinia necatrix]
MARIPRSRLCGMHAILPLAAAALAAASAQAGRPGPSFRDRCLAFDPRVHIPGGGADVALNRLEHVAAGATLAFPDNDASCNRPAQAVAADLCRVALAVPTSPRSGFTYELWLPENWNGRTLATGNGGLDGCVKYEDIAYGAANGFARLHTSVEIGKALAAAFYGAEAGKSYYIGCSLGGRQGIGAAARFPADFDGVVAGAPAVDFNSLYAWRASFLPATGAAGSAGFVAPETWKTTVHDEVLRQCDAAIDGVADGIIEDPTLCRVDTTKLLCNGSASASASNASSTTGCLSAAQVDVVTAVFADYTWPDGTLLYPRPNPGGEILAADGLYAGKPYGPSADWFKYAVLGDPAWDPAAYTRADAAAAARRDPAGIATWPASLAPFRARGGRVVTYHGQQDQQISSLNSARFWARLAAGDDGDDLDAFYRLFRIPGMNHCAGGPGAWAVGQGGSAPAYAIPFDAAHNVLAAVVDWVEKGRAPDTIVGTKFVGDSVDAGVAYRHRHCRYPYRSTYSGEGDPLDVESWDCVNFGA